MNVRLFDLHQQYLRGENDTIVKHAEAKLNSLFGVNNTFLIPINSKYIMVRFNSNKPTPATLESYLDKLTKNGISAEVFDKKARGYTGYSEWALDINNSLETIITKLDSSQSNTLKTGR